MSRTIPALMMCTLLSISGVCSAQLIAYEPFENLTNGNLVGQGSGFGWSDWEGGLAGGDSWKLHASANGGVVNVEDGALDYTDVDGNMLDVAGTQKARATGELGNARAFRAIAGTTFGTSLTDVVGVGNSYYMSFIGKREGQTDAEANMGTDPTPDNPYSRNSHFSIFAISGEVNKPNEQGIIGNTFITDDFNTWTFSGKATQIDTGVEFGGAEQRFVVFKVTVGGGLEGADAIEMWLDPSLASETAANTTNVAKVVGDYGDESDDLILPEGDFNGDETVNLADYVLWRNNLGAPDGTLLNDGDLTGNIGSEHYDLWKSNFGAEATEGLVPLQFDQAAIGLVAGNFSSGRAFGNMIYDEIRIGTTWESVTPHTAPQLLVGATNVPEPGSCILLVCGSAAALWAARRR